jgi:prepilin-type N-terminal cleavage/methylation domain-containing protein/prepilin-type processing-associated H-X9-DG protein
MSRPRSFVRGRAGFTLVELLVVIAIIGVLVALLLPAVQAAREAANRMSCGNNLKQLGIGIHNFHDTKKTLPPGGHSDAAPVGLAAVTDQNWGSSWLVWILPYMEEGPIYDKFTFPGSSGWGSTNNPIVAQNVFISSYFCPSSPLPKKCRSVPPGTPANTTIMASTYVGISGAANGLISGYTDPRVFIGTASNCCSGGHVSGGGVLIPGEWELTMANVTDGLSNTMFVGENGDFLVCQDGSKRDYRASSQHGWMIGSQHIDPPTSTAGGDWRSFNMTTVRWSINDKKGTKLGGSTPGWPNWPGDCAQFGVCENTSTNVPLNSAHPGGVQVLMGDGSVRFLSETTTMDVVAAAAIRDEGRATQLP